MKRLTVEADRRRIDEVTNFVDGALASVACEKKALRQINMAVEEIFLNVCAYAYGEEAGNVEIALDIDDAGLMTLCFADSGTPFDPLKKEDPDVHQPGRERKPGGLGIFMVKKTMDDMFYEYRDGKNTLTIKKKLLQEKES